MQRRSFVRNFAATLALASVTLATTIPVEGCSFNAEAAINTVLNSALAIIKVAEPGAPWVPALSNAISALQQAETTWKSGGSSTVVIDALNTLEAVLASIPATATYSPLVDVVVAGIEAVMAGFGLTAQLTPAASSKRAGIVNSSHYGRVKLHGPTVFHPTWVGSYTAQFNSTARSIGLPQAAIK